MIVTPEVVNWLDSEVSKEALNEVLPAPALSSDISFLTNNTHEINDFSLSEGSY